MSTMKTLAGLALSMAAASVHASNDSTNEFYLKGGFLGAGIGYTYGLNESFSLRSDVMTIGRHDHNGDISGFDYKGKLRNDVATLYGDWFPLGNGFRISFGLAVRDTQLAADANPSAAGTVEIGGQTVSYGPGDSAHAKVELPDVAPYLGIGYGHNVGQNTKTGWTFLADAGVYYGKPKVSFNINAHLYKKLNDVSGGRAQELVDQQTADIRDKVEKYKFLPAVYIGIGYRF